jgi:hypothetical protein
VVEHDWLCKKKQPSCQCLTCVKDADQECCFKEYNCPQTTCSDYEKEDIPDAK